MWAQNHSVSFLNKTNLTNDLTTEWCWMQMQGQSTCIHNLILQTNNIILLFTVACFYVLSLPSQYVHFYDKGIFLWCIESAFALVYRKWVTNHQHEDIAVSTRVQPYCCKTAKFTLCSFHNFFSKLACFAYLVTKQALEKKERENSQIKNWIED